MAAQSKVARGAPAPFAIAVQRDPGQPRAKCGLTVKQGELPDGAKPGFLHEIRCVGCPPRQSAEKAIHGWRVASHTGRERLLLPAVRQLAERPRRHPSLLVRDYASIVPRERFAPV